MHTHSFSNLSASVPSGALYKNLTLNLNSGELICLTGPNGSGKSTLLRQIAQRCSKFGICSLYLPQKTSSHRGSPGKSRAFDVFKAFRTFPENGVMLLDEPTNHLDDDAFFRLLKELKKNVYPILVASHDRRLLRSADRIYHLEDGKLENYGGDYDLYIEIRSTMKQSLEMDLELSRRREKQAEHQLVTNMNRQKKRQNHAEKLNRTQKDPKALVNARRNRAERTEASLQKKQKKIVANKNAERMDIKSKQLGSGKKFQINFDRPWKQNEAYIEIRDLNFLTDEGLLWKNNLNLSLQNRIRLGITGKNGSGKSTILHSFVGERSPEIGKILIHAVRPHLIRQLREFEDSNLTVLDFLCNDIYQSEKSSIRTSLSSVGFRGDDVYKNLSCLSGGERIRLELLRASLLKPDMLLLDEPTNDLDGPARDGLAAVLKDISISLIIVSHDPEFLKESGIDEILNLD